MLRRLAGQTAVYGVSTIVARFLNYLLFPYLSYRMSEEAYGAKEYMYGLIPLALVVLTMGLETGYFRFAGKAENEGRRRDVFATAWGAVSSVAVLFMVVVSLFAPGISDALGDGFYPSYICLMGAVIMFDVVTAIPMAKLRQEGRAVRFMVLRLCSVVINILFVLFFFSVLPGLSSGGGIWAMLYDGDYTPGYVLISNLAASFALLFMLYPVYRGIFPRIDRKLLGAMLVYSFPLLLGGIMGTANMFLDRQMLMFLLPEGESLSAIGVYTAATKMGVILILFVQMYRFAAEPFFLANFRKEEFVNANAEALKYFVIFSIFISLTVLLFRDIFVLLAGPGLRSGMVALPVILLANLFSGISFNLNFWYKKEEKTSYALRIMGVGLIFTVVLNIALIPLTGFMGAAWARLGCEAAMLVLSYYYNRRHYPTPYDLGRIGFYFLAGILIYSTTFVTVPTGAYVRYALNLLLLIAFGVCAVRMEKIDIKGVVRSVFKKQA